MLEATTGWFLDLVWRRPLQMVDAAGLFRLDNDKEFFFFFFFAVTYQRHDSCWCKFANAARSTTSWYG